MTIVIYQLNNETHWELSPALMRELVKMLTARVGRSTGSTILDIELANCRAALEAELQRLAPPCSPFGHEGFSACCPVATVTSFPADNSDLI
jgi:hypothetical protein